MNLRLCLISIVPARFISQKELGTVSSRTTEALDAILEANAPEVLKNIIAAEKDNSADETSIRESMAKGHRVRVKAIIEALGPIEGVRIARERLFIVGSSMGEEMRHRLRVGQNTKDALQAIRAMYKVLGIHFNVVEDEDGMLLIVDRCALSGHYDHDTCMVMSAADEGVVQGLYPGMRMRFEERMTSGAKNCVATIRFVKDQGDKG